MLFKILLFMLIIMLILLSVLVHLNFRLLQDIYKSVIDIQVDLSALITNSGHEFKKINDNVDQIVSGYDEMTQNVIKLMFGNPVVHD